MCRSAWAALTVVAAISVVGPAQAADDVTFRLDWKVYGTHAPFFIAEKQGFFKSEGLNVAIKEGGGSSKVVKLMGAGTDTFAFAAGVFLFFFCGAFGRCGILFGHLLGGRCHFRQIRFLVRIVGEVDLVASREAHGPVVTSIRIDRL